MYTDTIALSACIRVHPWSIPVSDERLKMKTWRIAGINFDHMHMGDLLRMVRDHPRAEIVGISDETTSHMEEAARNFNIPRDRIFTDYRKCLETTKPDVVILCPATAKHGEWTRKV